MPTYRWFRNGSLLTGQTSATLSFSPMNESDSGVYTCEGMVFDVSANASINVTVVGKFKFL